jgi:hypothetical protein
MANSDSVLDSVLRLAGRRVGFQPAHLEALKVVLGGVIAAIDALPKSTT